MFGGWLFRSRQLGRQGVLGINCRNAHCILDRNPRSRIPIVDDKLLMAELCRRVGVATPRILGVVGSHRELSLLPEVLRGREDFVLKPARGFGGRGVTVIVNRVGETFFKSSGRILDFDSLHALASDTLSGLYSLGGQPDRLLVQHRVKPHPALLSIAPQGVPDVRIILYRGEPAMAMLRLPTLASAGRANLHQGGIGVGLQLEDGRTHHAILGRRIVERHPDTGEDLLGRTVPDWNAMLSISRKTARAIGLGFVGIDIVLDAQEGPLLLEANARPGLAIQLANKAGLAAAIEQIDRKLSRPTSLR